ncbi:MAG: hypothetical protein CVU39_00900 [Chloroflexi bacterium HGW-Chloroflexi-10]|nr:MAG: hypothetical protein CVU39_00900 [Chloroflexi bacterium HGW-Chloroflexi-10]
MTHCQQFESNIWITNVSLGAFDVRAALIRGTQQTLIWDTLSHPKDMQPFASLLGAHDLRIVYSHADWDHCWGTAGLPYHEAQIIGHTSCQTRFATDVPRKLQEKQAQEPTRWETIQLVPPTTTFSDELIVDLGHLTLILSHLPGHTVDSIVAFLPEQGLLFMADAVETPFPVVKDKRSLPGWIAALQRWAHNPQVHTVIPAHGAIGGREILWQTISYLQSLLDQNPITLPEGLTDFYRVTHQMNVEICQDDR